MTSPPSGKNPFDSPAGLTVAQAAAALGVSGSSILRMIERGELRATKVRTRTGKEWRIVAEDVTALTEVKSPDTRNETTDKSGFHEDLTETDTKLKPDLTPPDTRLTPPDPEQLLAPIEARLTRIEGALAGKWVSELAEQLRKLDETNEGLRRELTEAREEACRREEVLVKQLAEIQQELRRSWWSRLWPWEKARPGGSLDQGKTPSTDGTKGEGASAPSPGDTGSDRED